MNFIIHCKQCKRKHYEQVSGDLDFIAADYLPCATCGSRDTVGKLIVDVRLARSASPTFSGEASIRSSALGLTGTILFHCGAPKRLLAVLEAWSKPSKMLEEPLFGKWLAESYERLNGDKWSWVPEKAENHNTDGYLQSKSHKRCVQLTHLSPVARREISRSFEATEEMNNLPQLVLAAAQLKSQKYGGMVDHLILGLITFVPIFPALPLSFPSKFISICPPEILKKINDLGFAEVWVIPPCSDEKESMAYKCV